MLYRFVVSVANRQVPKDNDYKLPEDMHLPAGAIHTGMVIEDIRGRNWTVETVQLVATETYTHDNGPTPNGVEYTYRVWVKL